MTNHKKLIDVTASLDRNCLSFTKGKVKIDQSVNMPGHRLSMGVACSYLSAPVCSHVNMMIELHKQVFLFFREQRLPGYAFLGASRRRHLF